MIDSDYSESMDKRTLELLALAGKLKQHSDEGVMILKTKPLAEILDSESDIDPERLPDNVIQLSDRESR